MRARFLQTGDAAVGVKGDDACADVDRGDLAHRAARAQRQFRGAAPDIDIQHRQPLAGGPGDGARPEGRQRGFQTVAGADHDELAGLRRKQLADGAGIAAPHRHPGQDQRAGVDVFRHDARRRVLRHDEGRQRIGVDRVVVAVRRQQHLGFMQQRALDHHVTGVEPFQHDPRERKMRGRRADVDADADQRDLVFGFHAAADIRKEYPTALLILLRHRVQTTVDILESVSSGFSYYSGFIRSSTPLRIRWAAYSLPI